MTGRLRFLCALNALVVAIEHLCDAVNAAALVTDDLLPQTLHALSTVISDEVATICEVYGWHEILYSVCLCDRMPEFDKLLRDALIPLVA